jgi:hypothetical protein
MKMLDIALTKETRTIVAFGDLRIIFQEDRDEEYVDSFIQQLGEMGIRVRKSETYDFDPTVDGFRPDHADESSNPS